MNKYLTKIAYTYPTLPKTEFDLAFEGDGNPNRERIKSVLNSINQHNYRDDLRSWKEDAPTSGDGYTTHAEYLAMHMDDMPDEDDYDRLKELEQERLGLAHKAGQKVEGPNSVGLGLGYGAGLLGMGLAVTKGNLAAGMMGAAAAIGTGLYHSYAQPEKRYNRFLEKVEAHQEQKRHILDLAGQDGV